MTLRLHHAKEPVRFIALIDRQPSSWVRRPASWRSDAGRRKDTPSLCAAAMNMWHEAVAVV